MSQKVFFTVVAVVYMVLGIANVLSPVAALGPMGVAFTPAAELFARVIGSTAIGFAIVNWGCRNAPPSRLFTLVLYGNLAEKVVQVVLILYALNAGIFNAMGWVMLTIQGVIGAGFAYFAFAKR